ncbi:MAG: acyltransferase family protein [Labilithrix sp.]|nr:acyltransferase family protein [Labilithrix sp.]
MRRSIAHIPGLDGLRGAAVIGVLLFHSNGLLRGGYLGVDLFFVLSGFLITSILIEEHRRSGRIDLRAFWVRRFRRLMPALLSLMPAVAIYAKALAAPTERASLRVDALATLGYVANWRAIFARRSYWEMFAAPSPLEHTWSLAIEEQFYVVWPLVVAGLLALGRGRVRALLVTSLGLMLASCVAMSVLFVEGATMRVYLGTDTRGAAILLGAVLAATGLARPETTSRSSRALDVAGLAALGVLGAAWWGLDGQSELLYRGGFWLTEIAAAVLIVCCVRARDGVVARLLASGPLRVMGLISYGVYLWHWPIYVVLTEERVGTGGLRLLALRVAVTLLVATFSYRLLEQPIRERGIRWARPIVVVPATLTLVVGIVLASTRSVGATPPASSVEAAAPVAKAAEPQATPAAAERAPIPVGSIPPASELPPGALRVLVLGDSVALSLGARMHFAQDTAKSYVDQRGVGDCSILDGIVPVFSMSGPPHGNGNCARSWLDDVAELRPDVTVIVIGGAYFSTVRVDGRRRSVCHPGWHDAYARRLSELLDAMKPFTGRRIVLGAAYPVGKWQTPTLNGNVDCYNRILQDAARSSSAEWIDLNTFVCPEGKCTVMSRDAPVRPDGLHFDGLGAEDTARWVLAQIRAGSPAP